MSLDPNKLLLYKEFNKSDSESFKNVEKKLCLLLKVTTENVTAKQKTQIIK